MAAQTQETIIAQGVKVEGEFTSQGDVLIEGEVVGTITIAGALRVGEQSQIRANVRAESAIVAGVIQGNISVEGRLELLESSHIDGDVEAGTLAVAAGCVLNGKVTMGKSTSDSR